MDLARLALNLASMLRHPWALVMEVGGGVVAAGAVIIVTLSVAAVLDPYTWLQILIFVWGIPPAMIGFGCGVEFVAKMTRKPVGGSSWKWAENR